MLFLCYRLAPAPLAGAPPFLITPVLRRMRAIEGWLEEEEAEPLAQVAQDHLEQPSPLKRIVEIGSYCGKVTFVLASVVNALGADASILAEGQPPVSAAKLVVVPVSARPTYRNFFDAINAVPGASDINIVSNSFRRYAGLDWRDRSAQSLPGADAVGRRPRRKLQAAGLAKLAGRLDLPGPR